MRGEQYVYDHPHRISEPSTNVIVGVLLAVLLLAGAAAAVAILGA